MKLKFIVAAIGLVAAAASQAAPVETTTAGGSSLTLNVWEDGTTAGTTAQSFYLNLGTTLTQFVTTGSQTSSTLATLLSTDSTWTSFLASSSSADLQWSVIASGNKVPSNTHTSILGTVTVGQEAVAAAQENGTLSLANVSVNGWLQAQQTADELVTAKGNDGYYLTFGNDSFGSNAWNNGNAIGATAEVNEASNNKNGDSALATINLLPGTFTFGQTGSNYVLSYNVVSAVPEAPASALMLAGFGALALVAVRRKKA